MGVEFCPMLFKKSIEMNIKKCNREKSVEPSYFFEKINETKKFLAKLYNKMTFQYQSWER